jgi:hypothetical protein
MGLMKTGQFGSWIPVRGERGGHVCQVHPIIFGQLYMKIRLLENILGLCFEASLVGKEKEISETHRHF